MKRVLSGSLVIALAFAARASAVDCLCENPTFNDGENGWTRWTSPGASGANWAITNFGPLAPEGTVGVSVGDAGWYQVIPATPGNSYSIDGVWRAGFLGTGAVEILLFSDNGSGIVNQLVNPVNAIVARKTGAAFDWELIEDSIAGGQTGSDTVVATSTSLVIGLKLTAVGTTTASFDSICVIPEPVSGLLLGVPMLALLRRRTRP